MSRASLDSLPDVLNAKDVASVLGIGYVKALKVIRFGGMNYLKVGKSYMVSKGNFVDWLNCDKPTIISID